MHGISSFRAGVKSDVLAWDELDFDNWSLDHGSPINYLVWDWGWIYLCHPRHPCIASRCPSHPYHPWHGHP